LEFCRCSVVVECADVVPAGIAWCIEITGDGMLVEVVGCVALTAGARIAAQVEVLAPASSGSLEAYDDVCDVPGLCGTVPGWVAIERDAAGGATFFRQWRCQAARGSLGCERSSVHEHLLIRTIEVGGPCGAVVCRQRCDALGRDGVGGFAGSDYGSVERGESKERDQ
jgi:hypothetical protein